MGGSLTCLFDDLVARFAPREAKPCIVFNSALCARKEVAIRAPAVTRHTTIDSAGEIDDRSHLGVFLRSLDAFFSIVTRYGGLHLGDGFGFVLVVVEVTTGGTRAALTPAVGRATPRAHARRAQLALLVEGFFEVVTFRRRGGSNGHLDLVGRFIEEVARPSPPRL